MFARCSGLLLVLICLLPLRVLAQDSGPHTRQAWVDSYRWLGAGVSASFPYADFGEAYNTGYGLHALLDRPLVPLINVSGDIGWIHFPGDGGSESADVWNVIVGARLVFGPIFVGGETGYISQANSWGWIPSFGLRFERLEFSLRYLTAGPDAWTTLRAGFYF